MLTVLVRDAELLCFCSVGSVGSCGLADGLVGCCFCCCYFYIVVYGRHTLYLQTSRDWLIDNVNTIFSSFRFLLSCGVLGWGCLGTREVVNPILTQTLVSNSDRVA